MTDTRPDEVELFRFAAVRPPKLALGSLAVIPLELTLSSVDPPLFDPVTGVLADATVTIANQQTAFPLGKLDRELAKRNDRWAPPEIEKWVKDSTGRNTRDFVAASGWSVHRRRVHWFLADAFRSEDEIEGDIANGHLVRPTVMLRACRLIGLVESLAGQRDRLAYADTVQRFLRYATVQLSPDLLLPNPNPLARPQ